MYRQHKRRFYPKRIEYVRRTIITIKQEETENKNKHSINELNKMLDRI